MRNGKPGVYPHAQADNFYAGESISWTTGFWASKNYANEPELAKGVLSTIDGNLIVHPARAFDSNGNKVYMTCPVKANVPFGIIFDEIKQAGSTGGLFASGAMLILL